MKEYTEIKKMSLFGNLAGFGVVTGLLLVSLFSFSGVHVVHAEEKMTLFVSTGCPHCLKVTEFIAEYGIDNKFVVLNVHTDDGAAEKYTDFVTEQELPLNEQGTPTLVYDGDKLVVGDTPIIDFLAERYELSEDDRVNGSANGSTNGGTDDSTDDSTGDSTDDKLYDNKVNGSTKGGTDGSTKGKPYDNGRLSLTFGDYIVFGIGLIVVSSVVGYGIVNLVNGRSKS